MEFLPKVLSWKKKLLSFIILTFLITVNCYLLTAKPASAATAPNPQPCKNAVLDDSKLTDNYITDPSGNPPGTPPLEFTFTGSGTPGTNVSGYATKPASLDYTVDFSQLQAIFGTPSSDFLEGAYQNQNHRDVNLQNTQGADFNSYHGPGQKTAPIILTDKLRVDYVKYVFNKPELPESTSVYKDINGQNPHTIYEMITALNFPNPPVPPSLGGDKNIWDTSWGMYWEKIPTAFSEFYIGKLEFRAIAGLDLINQVKTAKDKSGAFSPICPVPIKTVEFVMPDFYRSTATSGELNQIVVPLNTQSPTSSNFFRLADGAKNFMAEVIQKCVYLATQNPISKKLHKVVSQVIKTLNPVKDVYAVTSGTNKAIGLNVTQSCNANNTVRINFGWTSADNPSGGFSVQAQFLDFSVFNNNFASGTFQGFDVGVGSNSASSTTLNNGSNIDFASNTNYFWRINTEYFGAWSPSITSPFTSIDCTPPAPACVFSPTTITAGSSVGIIANNFTINPIPVNLVGTVFGNVVSVGSIPQTGGSVTIPTSTAGTFEVRLGNTGATTTCTGTLTVNALPVTCSYTTTANPIITGSQITVTYQNTIAGDSIVLADRIVGNIVQTFGLTQDSFGGPINATFTLTAPAGGYGVVIQPPGPVLANLANCGNLDITVVTTSCLVNPVSVSAGGTFNVGGLNFAPVVVHTVGITGFFPKANNTFPNLASLFQNTQTGAWTATVTVPSTAPSGTYIVRVDNSVVCAPNLTVTAVLATCSFTSSAPPIITGSQITVTYQGTSAGDSIVLADRLGATIGQTFGLTQDSLGASVTATFTLTAPAGGYSVLIQFPGPVVGNAANCGNLDIIASAAATCSVNTSSVAQGGSLTINAANFGIGPLPVRMLGAFQTIPTDLAILNSDPFSVTITISASQPAGSYRVYVDAGGFGKVFCTPDPISVTTATTSGGPITFNPLSTDSCIKNPKSSKDSTAPYCALPLKNHLGQDNLTAAEAATCTNKTDTNKLDTDNPRVICTFTIVWDNSKPFTIPTLAEGNGAWDSCDNGVPVRNCSMTIAVWPDFRIPLIAETWNNTLYSEADASTNSNQITGRPGVYSYFVPKGAEDALAKDPIQIMIDKCASSPPGDGIHIPIGCEDLANFGATHSTLYQGFADCINTSLFSAPKLIACFNLVARSIVNITLPGEVTNQTTGVKQRFIGATDCFKQFVRDVALKPLALQKALGVEQSCKATASP